MSTAKDITLTLSFKDDGSVQVKRASSAVKKELAGLGQSAEKSGKGFDKLKGRVQESNRGMGKFRTMMKSTWAQMAAGMGIMMGVQGVIRLIGRGLSSTMKVGREFEREWANTTTMMDLSTEKMNDMKTELMNLSPILGDVTDLAKGMYQVLSASIDPSKAIMFIGEAAKTAQAGVTDTTTAVDALTTVLNAYGMEAEQVSRVSDIMFATVKKGKLTYEGMAGALGTVAPMAAQLGVSFDEIGAAMATLTKQGIDVNTTTVQLRQVMVSVLKPTSEAEEMARKLGISFNSATLKSMGLAKFIGMVTKATNEDSDALTALFGNVRALTGIMGLGGKRAKDFAEVLEFVRDKVKYTEEAFKKQMVTTDFWMKVMGNVMKKFKIAIFQGFSEPFKQGISDSKSMEEKMTDLQTKVIALGTSIGQHIGKAIKYITEIKFAVLDTAKAFGLLWGVSKIIKWSKAIKFASAAAYADMGKIGKAGQGLRLGMKGLGVGVAVVGAAFAGWKIGRAIGQLKIAGVSIDEHIQKWKVWNIFIKKQEEVIDNVVDAEGRLLRKKKLIDAAQEHSIKPIETQMQALKLLTKVYHEQGKTGTDWIDELVKKQQHYTAEVVSAADEQVEALNKTEEFWLNAARQQTQPMGKIITNLISIEEEYKALGQTAPAEVLKVRSALEQQLSAQKQTKASYENLVNTFKASLPNLEAITTNTNAMGDAMTGFKKEGYDADKLLIQFKDDIEKTYAEAKKYADLTNTQVNPELQAMHDKLVDLGVVEWEHKDALTAMAEATVDYIRGTTDMEKAAASLGVTLQDELDANIITLESNFRALMESGKLNAVQQQKAAGKIVVAYEEAGKEVPEEFAAMAKASEETASTIRTRMVEAASKISSVFRVAGASIGGNFGELITGVAHFADTAGAYFRGLKDMTEFSFEELAAAVAGSMGDIGGSIGQMISGAEDSYAELAAGIGGALGSIFGPVGTAIGSFVGGLFGGLFKKETEAEKKARELEAAIRGVKGELWDMGNISDSVAKEILELAENVGMTRAKLLMLPEIIDDVGISMRNMTGISGRLQDVLLGIQSGILTLSDGLEIAGGAWDSFIAGVHLLGQEGSPEVREFLNLVRELGISIQEVDEYVYEWLTGATAGLGAMVTAAGDSAGEMSYLGNITQATFEGFISQGQDFAGTLDTMLEPMLALKEKYDELGVAGSDAIDRLLEIAQLKDIHQDLFKAIEGNRQVLEGLGNTGFLTGQTLSEIGEQVGLYYSRLQEIGLSSDEALRVMVPTFRKLEHYAEAYDYQLGAGVQALIDEARETGIYQDSFIDVLTQGIESIVDAIEDVVDAIHDRDDGGAIEAQHGYHGEVTGPQSFYVEPGRRERVDITPVGEIPPTGGGPINMRPILIPWSDMEGWLLQFIEEKAEGENILLSSRSNR